MASFIAIHYRNIDFFSFFVHHLTFLKHMQPVLSTIWFVTESTASGIKCIEFIISQQIGEQLLMVNGFRDF